MRHLVARDTLEDRDMATLNAAPLGKLLVDSGVVSKSALEEVLSVQRSDKRRLGELLVERGLVRPQQLAQILSQQLSCPWVALQRIEIAPNVLSTLPREVAIEHEVVPVYLRSVGAAKTLYVATADPTDDVMIADCARAAKMTVKPVVAMTSDIRAALTKHFNVPGVRPPLPSRIEPAGEAPKQEEIEDVEVVELVDATPAELRKATVLVLTAPERFLTQCKHVASTLGATLLEGTLAQAGELVTEHKPCAIVVTEDVYAFDRNGLNRIALENDAVLVVWTEDAESRQLEPLVDAAIKRWRRAAYEKGAVIDGRYELLRDLGGPVATSRWEVRHAKTGRRSILHVAAGPKNGSEDDAAGVRRQQQALARVTHPGTLDLRDAGTTERGDPYVVLEALDGKTLEGVVAARGKLPIPDACALALQVANVLAVAHAAGVVHGDVRPEHIVLIRDGYGVERAKLVGWQSARVVDGEADGQADVAALATFLFTAIVGQTPKRDETPAGDFPAEVAKLLARAASSTERFGSAAELARAIERAVPRATEPSKLLERARRRSLPAPEEAAKSGAELRRYPRAPYRTPVRVEVPGLGSVDGRTEDISAHGLFVVTRATISVGTEVTVRFALPVDGKVVAEKAVVKWSRAATVSEGADTHAVGLEIADPAAETSRQVHKYVSLMSSDSDEP